MASTRRARRAKKKAAGKSKVFKVVSTILIIAGLLVLGFAGLERGLVYYNQMKLRDAFKASAGFNHLEDDGVGFVEITAWEPMRLIAPAIEMDLMAVGGGDVFDRELLDLGPAHFQMSDLPNTERGNVAFAGHRAGRWNFFLKINELVEGDDIYLDVAGYRFVYKVEWVRVFDKYDWEPIESTDYPAITLQTCEPPHVSNPDYRLMARGRLDHVEPAPLEAPPAN